MLDNETKRRIDTARDILVGKVPDPKSQVEQITIALIYKFMDDMDTDAEELGGEPSFFTGEYEKYGWRRIFDPGLGGFEMLSLYSEAILKMAQNPNLPQLFRDIFKNAYLPYRDPETLKSFLKIINQFTYDHSEKLGDAFEYLLSVLGSQGDAGQFRTPRHIIDFVSALIAPKKNESILDPACGTAGFLISAYKHILKENSSNWDAAKDPHAFELHNVKLDELTVNGKQYNGDRITPDERARLINNIKGYDISPDMVRLSLVNLYLHGFTDPHISEYDTLTSEDRWNEYFDVILANPPFMTPKGGIRPHKRFSIKSNRSEVLFVDYMAEHLTPTGRAGIIVPEGIIFQSATAYKSLRKMLVDEHYLVGVISLPAGVFNPYSGVKTSILWLDKPLARMTDKILFAKVEADGFDLGAQRRPIKANDLPEVFNKLTAYRKALFNGEPIEFTDDKLVSLVPKAEIGENGEYNLSGERYKLDSFISSKFEIVRLGDICDINPKKSELKELELDTEVSFVPMQDVNEHNISFLPKEKRKLAEVLKGAYTYFQNDDVVLAKVTPCFENGKAGLAKNLLNGIGFGSSELFVIRGSNQILPQFIFQIVTSNVFREYSIPKMTGTGGLQRVPKSCLEDFMFPLPPISVQKEIVAEIESYQNEIEELKKKIAINEQKIKDRIAKVWGE